MEAGAVIGAEGEVLHWHLPAGRTSGSLPDSRPLWDVLWEHRATLTGFAHSHPGGGTPQPSMEDITTFAAVEAALGRQLVWWITSSDSMVSIHWMGPARQQYRGVPVRREDEPAWADRLRRTSDEQAHQERKETQT